MQVASSLMSHAKFAVTTALVNITESLLVTGKNFFLLFFPIPVPSCSRPKLLPPSQGFCDFSIQRFHLNELLSKSFPFIFLTPGLYLSSSPAFECLFVLVPQSGSQEEKENDHKLYPLTIGCTFLVHGTKKSSKAAPFLFVNLFPSLVIHLNPWSLFLLQKWIPIRSIIYPYLIHSRLLSSLSFLYNSVWRVSAIK